MESIRDKVAIIGMGCTKFGEHWNKSVDDMVIDAAYEALEDAGIERQDIQAAWLGTSISGTSGVCLSAPLKLQNIPVTRVENACATGTEAVRGACYALIARAYDIVLALGVEKLKDSGLSGLPNLSSPVGAVGVMHPVIGAIHTAPGNFALAATHYFHHYGLSGEEGRRTIAKIAVKNHRNGSLHPKAHFQRELTLEQVLNAPIVAWPLGLLDCCPTTDGCAAAVLVRVEDIKNFRSDPMLVKGLGISCGPGTGRVRSDYDYLHIAETVAAGKQAYEQAGITDPFRQIDLAVVHDCFTITELLIYEDLGFCPRGTAKEYINEGTFTLEGALPVNSDGGLKSFGHPIGATGLRMIYEIYRQIQGRAELRQRQLKDVSIGLTHNIGGGPGAGVCAVGIFGR
jgi:acetyl-CoA C-acetyltransferase